MSDRVAVLREALAIVKTVANWDTFGEHGNLVQAARHAEPRIREALASTPGEDGRCGVRVVAPAGFRPVSWLDAAGLIRINQVAADLFYVDEGCMGPTRPITLAELHKRFPAPTQPEGERKEMHCAQCAHEWIYHAFGRCTFAITPGVRCGCDTKRAETVSETVREIPRAWSFQGNGTCTGCKAWTAVYTPKPENSAGPFLCRFCLFRYEERSATPPSPPPAEPTALLPALREIARLDAALAEANQRAGQWATRATEAEEQEARHGDHISKLAAEKYGIAAQLEATKVLLVEACDLLERWGHHGDVAAFLARPDVIAARRA